MKDAFEKYDTGYTDIDLIVACHAKYDIPVHNGCYKIVTDLNAEAPNTDLEIIRDDGNATFSKLSHSMGELSYYSYFACRVNMKKYVGTCHYGRYFSFMDDIPNMDEIFSEYGCVVYTDSNLIGGDTMINQFRSCHNEDDLIFAFSIVPELFPEYTIYEVMKCLESEPFSICNIVIMKREDFQKWVYFYSSVMLEFNRRKGIENDDDTRRYVETRGECIDVDYESRLHGFIIERLTNLFIWHNFDRILLDDVSGNITTPSVDIQMPEVPFLVG